MYKKKKCLLGLFSLSLLFFQFYNKSSNWMFCFSAVVLSSVECWVTVQKGGGVIAQGTASPPLHLKDLECARDADATTSSDSLPQSMLLTPFPCQVMNLWYLCDKPRKGNRVASSLTLYSSCLVTGNKSHEAMFCTSHARREMASS